MATVGLDARKKTGGRSLVKRKEREGVEKGRNSPVYTGVGKIKVYPFREKKRGGTKGGLSQFRKNDHFETHS